MVNLYPHQVEALKLTEGRNRVAYYYDMGLGKTYIGSEKAISLQQTILVVCQKSKVSDWYLHFLQNYSNKEDCVYDLTSGDKSIERFVKSSELINEHKLPHILIGVINYDLLWRRKDLLKLTSFTLLLDESSLIQNETSKRAKFILNKLKPDNVILLSGTPISGKYEQLWSQCNLLGWKISKKLFFRQYVIVKHTLDGYPIITGYKNVDRLKRKLREYGAVFMKTEEVIDLPSQNFIDIKVPESKEFKKFKKERIITINDTTLVGDTTLTNMLYQRMLCGHFNNAKLDAFRDILESTNDRLVVFYNFNDELAKLREISLEYGRKLSFCNGTDKDLSNFENCENGLILVQYQSGAYGLNLQKANKIVYFSPPLSSDLFEQSKKRIHRIGQEHPCFYYQLKSGIDYRIYDVLAMRRDYTDKLFEEGEENERNIN